MNSRAYNGRWFLFDGLLWSFESIFIEKKITNVKEPVKFLFVFQLTKSEELCVVCR